MGIASSYFAAGFTKDPSYNLVMYELPGFTKVPDFTDYNLNNGAAQDSAFTRQVDKFCIVRSNSPSLNDVFFVYDTSTWNRITGWQSLPGTNTFGCDFSRDGSILLICSGFSPYVLLYDTTAKTYTAPTVTPHSYPQCARFSHDGTLCAVGFSSSPSLIIYDTSTWNAIAGPASPPNGAIYDVSWSEDDSRLLCGCTSGGPSLVVFETTGWTRLDQWLVGPLNTNSRGSIISPDGLYVGQSTSSGSYIHIYGWNPGGGYWEPVATGFSLPMWGASMDWSGDQSILACGAYGPPWCNYYDTTDPNPDNWTELAAPSNLPLGNVGGGRFDKPLGAPPAAGGPKILLGTNF